MAERRTTEKDGRLRDDGSEGDVRLETLRVLHLLGMNPFCMFRQQGRHRRLANDWRAPNHAELAKLHKLRGVDLDPRFSRPKIPKPQHRSRVGYPADCRLGC